MRVTLDILAASFVFIGLWLGLVRYLVAGHSVLLTNVHAASI